MKNMAFFGLSNISMNYCIVAYYNYTIRLSGFLLGYAIPIIYIKNRIGKQKTKAMKKKNQMLAEFYWMNYFREN